MFAMMALTLSFIACDKEKENLGKENETQEQGKDNGKEDGKETGNENPIPAIVDTDDGLTSSLLIHDDGVDNRIVATFQLNENKDTVCTSLLVMMVFQDEQTAQAFYETLSHENQEFPVLIEGNKIVSDMTELVQGESKSDVIAIMSIVLAGSLNPSDNDLIISPDGLSATSILNISGNVVQTTAVFWEKAKNDTVCTTFIITITFPSEEIGKLAYDKASEYEAIKDELLDGGFDLTLDDSNNMIVDMTSPMSGAPKRLVMENVIDPTTVLEPFNDLFEWVLQQQQQKR